MENNLGDDTQRESHSLPLSSLSSFVSSYNVSTLLFCSMKTITYFKYIIKGLSIFLRQTLLIIFHIFFLSFLDDCTKEDGTKCLNGVCLDSVCHCNDGFGGCNCQVPGQLKDRIIIKFIRRLFSIIL